MNQDFLFDVTDEKNGISEVRREFEKILNRRLEFPVLELPLVQVSEETHKRIEDLDARLLKLARACGVRFVRSQYAQLQGDLQRAHVARVIPQSLLDRHALFRQLTLDLTDL